MVNQVLMLLSVQFNLSAVRELSQILSKEEWLAKQLSKETMTKLGLKGSPKLSKILMGMGVPQKRVELALSGSKVRASTTEVIYYVYPEQDEHKSKENEWFVWNQTSTHFNSCQHSGSTHDMREGDWGDFKNSRLFFWVAGGTELKARAKVRLMTVHPDNMDDGFYLYIDRPYGQSSLLMEDFETLVEFGNELGKGEDYDFPFLGVVMPPVWERPNGMGTDFQRKYGGVWKGKPLYNWASAGYMDTLTRGQGPYTCFVSVHEGSGQSLLYKAYSNRLKEGGVYLESIQSVEWNSQKGLKFHEPVDNRNLTKDPNSYRDYSKEIHALVKAGYKPEGHVRYSNHGVDSIVAGGMVWSLHLGYCSARGESSRFLRLKVVVGQGRVLTVRSGYDIGFMRANPINPLQYNEVEDCMEVSLYQYDKETRERLCKMGWAVADVDNDFFSFLEEDYNYDGDADGDL